MRCSTNVFDYHRQKHIATATTEHQRSYMGSANEKRCTTAAEHPVRPTHCDSSLRSCANCYRCPLSTRAIGEARCQWTRTTSKTCQGTQTCRCSTASTTYRRDSGGCKSFSSFSTFAPLSWSQRAEAVGMYVAHFLGQSQLAYDAQLVICRRSSQKLTFYLHLMRKPLTPPLLMLIMLILVLRTTHLTLEVKGHARLPRLQLLDRR